MVGSSRKGIVFYFAQRLAQLVNNSGTAVESKVLCLVREVVAAPQMCVLAAAGSSLFATGNPERVWNKITYLPIADAGQKKVGGTW